MRREPGAAHLERRRIHRNPAARLRQPGGGDHAWDAVRRNRDEQVIRLGRAGLESDLLARRIDRRRLPQRLESDLSRRQLPEHHSPDLGSRGRHRRRFDGDHVDPAFRSDSAPHQVIV